MQKPKEWIGIMGGRHMPDGRVIEYIDADVEDILKGGHGIIAGGTGVNAVILSKVLRADPHCRFIHPIVPEEEDDVVDMFEVAVASGAVTEQEAMENMRRIEELRVRTPEALLMLPKQNIAEEAGDSLPHPIIGHANRLIIYDDMQTPHVANTIEFARRRKIPTEVKHYGELHPHVA